MEPTSSCSCNCRNTMTSRRRQLQKPCLPRCLCVHSLTFIMHFDMYIVLQDGRTHLTLSFRRLVGDVHSVVHPCRTLRTEKKDYPLRSEVENFNLARPAGQQPESGEEAEIHMTLSHLPSSCAWYLITPGHRPMNQPFLKVYLSPKLHK